MSGQAQEIREAPLFLQVAAHLRHRIAAGDLRSGDALPSLRRGGTLWGVNLHTVRRAYRHLEEAGLIRTSHGRVPRVTADAPAAAPDREDGVEAFLAWVTWAGLTRFGLTRAGLARRLANLDESSPGPVWVVECSKSLAVSLAEQIRERTGLDARPHVLSAARELPPGRCLSTYYHYAEVRKALEGRQPPATFFRVHLDRRNLARLAARARPPGRVILLGVDGQTGRAIGADLEAVLGKDVAVEVRITRQPTKALRRVPPNVPVILSPENWDRVEEEARGSPWLFPVALSPDDEDLARIAERYGRGR